MDIQSTARLWQMQLDALRALWLLEAEAGVGAWVTSTLHTCSQASKSC